MNKPKLYAERDVSEYPDFYIAHVEAMTTEKLHSKAAIAAELAYRDKRIAELEKDLQRIRGTGEFKERNKYIQQVNC